MSNAGLKTLADELGLDTGTFNQCLDSGKYTETVQTATRTAQSLGVRSTPAFIINGLPMLGAQPFAAFQQVIEQAAAEGLN